MQPVEALLAEASDAGFFAGVPLGRWYPELADCLLVTVTEKRTRAGDRRLAELRQSAQIAARMSMRDTSRASDCVDTRTLRTAKLTCMRTTRNTPCSNFQAGAALRCRRRDVPDVPLAELLPADAVADAPPPLPELAEPDIVRHFVNLSTLNMSVDTHFYPLGSCTMKYNPKRNERLASLPGFADLHPYQPEETLQGMLELLYELQQMLAEISGLPAVSLQPAAGAHGELTALLVAAAYFRDRGEQRTEGAHSRQRPRHQSGQRRHGRLRHRAPSRARRAGCVDLDDLRRQLDDQHGRVHDHQPQHAGHVRPRRSPRSPTMVHARRRPDLSRRREHERHPGHHAGPAISAPT